MLRCYPTSGCVIQSEKKKLLICYQNSECSGTYAYMLPG